MAIATCSMRLIRALNTWFRVSMPGLRNEAASRCSFLNRDAIRS